MATELLDEIAALGGAVEAIEKGFQQSHIEESAYLEARRMEKGESRVVGVNCYTDDGVDLIPVWRIRPEVERDQTRRLADFRRRRDDGTVRGSLSAVRDSADGTTNLLYPMKQALRVGATIGEISDVLRLSFGEYRPR